MVCYMTFQFSVTRWNSYQPPPPPSRSVSSSPPPPPPTFKSYSPSMCRSSTWWNCGGGEVHLQVSNLFLIFTYFHFNSHMYSDPQYTRTLNLIHNFKPLFAIVKNHFGLIIYAMSQNSIRIKTISHTLIVCEIVTAPTRYLPRMLKRNLNLFCINVTKFTNKMQ